MFDVEISLDSSISSSNKLVHNSKLLKADLVYMGYYAPDNSFKNINFYFLNNQVHINQQTHYIRMNYLLNDKFATA